MKIGHLVQAFRAEYCITQEHFAETFDVSVHTVIRWEVHDISARKLMARRILKQMNEYVQRRTQS